MVSILNLYWENMGKMKKKLKLKFDSVTFSFKSEKKEIVSFFLKDLISRFSLISLKYSNILKIIKVFQVLKIDKKSNCFAILKMKLFLTN